MTIGSVSVQLAGGGSLEFRLDRKAGVPLHLQLFEQLKHFIGTKRMAQGAPLPSVRQLARELSVSSVTVVRAIEELRHRGLVETHQGKGVYVIDFTRADQAARSRARLQDFAREVVRQAIGIGLDRDEVVRAICDLPTSQPRRDPRNIVVVDEFQSVDLQVEYLRRELSNMRVDITGVRLAAIDAADGLLDRAALIVSAPHCFGLVRGRLKQRSNDILGLTFTLDPDILRQLRSVPPAARVALIGTLPEFLGWMSYLVGQQMLLDTDPVEAAMTDLAAVARAIDGADVVLYGSGVRDELPTMLPPAATGIELRHIPDAESVEVLRGRLRSLGVHDSGYA